jgi:hypothetical protein
MAGYIGSKAVNLSTTGADINGDADVSGDLTVDTNTLHVDSTNNRVGIGTSLPARTLEVYSTAPAIKLNNGTNAFTIGTGAFVDGSNSLVFFDEGVGERMRLDSSGNLLVGQTNVSTSAAGNIFTQTGKAYHIVTGDTPLFVDRKSNDGQLVEFRRDQTVVGSIGAVSGDLVIDGASGDAGLRFLGSTVRPRDNGALSDGGIDLGASNGRFKDLYLSGGVYLGGTGASNYLDDYEEGTYTVTATPSGSGSLTVDGALDELAYTKIGRLVTVTGSIDISAVSSATGYINISLPFTGASLNQQSGRASGAVTIYNVASNNSADFKLLYVSGANVRIYVGDGTSINSDAAQQMTSNTVIAVTFSYLV